MLKGIVKGNNLFDINATDTDKGYLYHKYLSENGGVSAATSACVSEYIDISDYGTITVSGMNDSESSSISLCFYDVSKNYVSGGKYNKQTVCTYTVPNGAKYCRFTYLEDATECMLNSGSQALPYEPYQTIHDITRIPMRSKNLSTMNTVNDVIVNNYYKNNRITDMELSAGTYTISFIIEEKTNGLLSGTVGIGDSVGYKKDIKDYQTPDGTPYSRNVTFTITQSDIDSYGGFVWVRFVRAQSKTDFSYKISEIMLNEGDTALPYVPYGMVEGWEVRDQQGRIIWGADKTLTGTDSITYKGYGLDIKEYSIDGNMVQAAEKAYSITGTSPLDFQSNGSNATISISGNETQASNQAYTTSGTSPLSFNADGTNLTALSMDGNMSQESTPSPSSPITPIECGVLSENLFDNNQITTNENGAERPGVELPAGTYSIYNTSGQAVYYRIGDSGTGAQVNNGNSKANIVANDTLYVWQYPKKDGVMVIEGATAPTEYEPYGKYKIPITVGSTTKNIFINQPIRKIGNYSDSIGSDGVVTRNIKKLVLNGTENFSTDGNTGTYYRYSLTLDNDAIANIPCVSSHFPYSLSYSGDYVHCYISTTLYIFSEFSTRQDFMSWIADEYSTSHPVEVWYVLSTPDTTETTTIPTISTANGSNTLTTQTDITPSNITISTSSSVYPKNPIYPEECGDRTAQMIDYTQSEQGGIDASGNLVSGDTLWRTNVYTPITEDEQICVSTNNALLRIYFYTSNKTFISRVECSVGSNVFTPPSGTAFIKWTVYRADGITLEQIAAMHIMVNEGSTALPYEPYGYKIPITINSNTQNIYTKEPIRKIGNYADVVNSDGSITRKIKHVVFNGTEVGLYKNNDAQPTNYLYYANLTVSPWKLAPEYATGFCSHLSTISDTPITDVGFNVRYTGRTLYFNFGSEIMNSQTSGNTIQGFKEYLANQYASGHPVEVWYPLATPTTEQTTIPTLTTVNGKNTATIGTTLAPSSITINATSKVYPNNPIIPEECGDLTENLGNLENGFIDPTTGADSSTGVYGVRTQYIACSGESTYTMSTEIYPYHSFVAFYDSSKTYLSRTSADLISSSRTFTTPSTASFMRVTLYYNGGSAIKPSETNGLNFMLNSGNMAKPYEPYGKYKVPIINNGVTKNIYLNQPIRKIGNYADIVRSDGTVERKIKKLVFDGTETTWGNPIGSGDKLRITMNMTSLSVGLCSHYPFGNAENPGEFDLAVGLYLRFNIVGIATTRDEWKAYLAAQYSAGNPVEVWYVLATPETESITTPTISTIEGVNTIEVDTTLSPSKIDITLHGKYAMWNAIRNDVRNGTAPSKYPIGTILYDSLTDGTGTAFQVVAYDHHFDPSLTAQGYTHSMTLCEYKLTDIYQFDAIESFLYTNKIIPAGTYRFTIPNYDAAYGGNKTYYFTSTADLPKNSQIVLTWAYQTPPASVTAYSPTASISAQENTTASTGWSNLTLTEYVSGESPAATDLGTIAGPTTQAGTSNYGEMNHIHRARYGSNNYLQSGLRQYLNASTAANTWWKPQTVFDRPYSQRNQAGKLSKLNQNMVSVLAKPEIQSRTNSYFETTSLDGTTFTVNTNYSITTDKLFLLSPMEVGFNTTDTTVGTLLDYYIAGTSTDANNKRIKVRTSNNSAYYWWLRTPHPSFCYVVRRVLTSGALNYNYALNSFGVAAACIIQ